MRASLVALEQQLSDLRKYVRLLRVTSDLSQLGSAGVEPNLQEALLAEFISLAVSPAKRRYDYSAVIVTLYGAVEQFLESILRAYARHLNSVYSKYSELPENIVSRHFDLTTQLMARIDEARYRGIITPEQLVSNLHSCLSNSVSYVLNDYAFCHHTSNFRSSLIDELFKGLELNNVLGSARLCPIFATHLKQSFAEQDLPQLKPSQVFSCLNDLAERRNDVAHGNVQEILSLDILEDYIDYHERLCAAIYDVVISAAVGVVASQKGKCLGKPIAVFDHRIVCITMRNTPVSVGDTLISEAGHGPCPFASGEIQEIQVSHSRCDSVGSWPWINVAMRVEFRAPNGGVYYLVPQ
jgi:hypothetical protein